MKEPKPSKLPKGIFRPKYRAPDGTLRESQILWIRYMDRTGRYIRESTETTKITKAKEKLDKRRGTVADGKPINLKADRIVMDVLFKYVIDDYANNDKRSIGNVKTRLKKRLEPWFSGRRAITVTSADVEAYKSQMLQRVNEEGQNELSRATINRDLSILNRGFSLALKYGTLTFKPVISKLEENNVRQGMLTEAQFETLRKNLPADIAAPVMIAFLTGWRLASEILTRKWAHVDFEREVLRLEPGETKNKQGRSFPMILDELRDTLKEQRIRADCLRKERRLMCPYVFFRMDGSKFEGQPLIDSHCKLTAYFRRAWKNACVAAGLVGQIPHDFRRVAVSRLERVGISRKVAMELTGHLTESIYRRYHIVHETDLREAVKKLNSEIHSKVIAK